MTKVTEDRQEAGQEVRKPQTRKFYRRNGDISEKLGELDVITIEDDEIANKVYTYQARERGWTPIEYAAIVHLIRNFSVAGHLDWGLAEYTAPVMVRLLTEKWGSKILVQKVNQFRKTGLVSAFLPQHRSVKRKKHLRRTAPTVEANQADKPKNGPAPTKPKTDTMGLIQEIQKVALEKLRLVNFCPICGQGLRGIMALLNTENKES